MTKKIVAGNWKMNTTLKEAVELAEGIAKGNPDKKDITVIIAPPFPFIKSVKDVVGTNVNIAAQNCSSEEKGAFTGEISAAMLKSVGVEYVILGHSERRMYFKETNEQLQKKLTQCFSNSLIPIFCVGEHLEERKSHKYFETIETQLKEVLFELSASELKTLIIAYEPVWAIGTGQTATTEQAREMHGFIRAVLSQKFGKKTADSIPLLYGGSCNSDNAKELFACKDVNGGLIGGASLKASSFLSIVNSFN